MDLSLAARSALAQLHLEPRPLPFQQGNERGDQPCDYAVTGGARTDVNGTATFNDAHGCVTGKSK
jgi:hypothetical protein